MTMKPKVTWSEGCEPYYCCAPGGTNTAVVNQNQSGFWSWRHYSTGAYGENIPSAEEAKAACEEHLAKVGLGSAHPDQGPMLVPMTPRPAVAEDAEAKHAASLTEEIDYGMVSQILLQAGHAIPARKLQLAVELARVAS